MADVPTKTARYGVNARRLCIRLGDDLGKAVAAEAERSKRSQAEVVRSAVASAVRGEKSG